MKPARRLALALVIGDFTLFALFFAVALFRHSANSVLPLYAMRWEFATAGIDFLRWLPPLQFFVALVSMATYRGEAEGLVAKITVPAIVISILLSAAGLLLEPVLIRQVATCITTSQRFTVAMDELKSALGAGEAEKARQAFDILEAIDPADMRLTEYQKKLSNLEIKREREGAKAQEEKEAAELFDPVGGKTAWLRAKDFYAKGDWYNAHWQATLAQRLDPGLLEAKRLAALAWEEIAKGKGETARDEAEAAFYSKKLRGYGLIRSEDYVGAWRIFSELSKDRGNDTEVRRYLKESLAGIERTAFFRDEADAAAVDSSIPRLFVRFKAEKGGERVLVAAESAWESGAAYLFDLEYLEVRPDGSTLIVRSRWGKLTGGRLYLVAADRAVPGLAFRASALELPPSTPIERGRETRAPASIELGIPVDELMSLTAARSSPRELKVLDAWNTLAKAQAYGIDPEVLLLELLRRQGLPFALFGSAALGILVGLRFRMPGTGRGFPLPVLPFLGFVVFFLWSLVERLDLLASAWAARFLPNLGALALSAGLRTGFIIAAVLLAVGASRASLPTDNETTAD